MISQLEEALVDLMNTLLVEEVVLDSTNNQLEVPEEADTTSII